MEQRFFLVTVEMGHTTADMPGLMAQTQNLIACAMQMVASLKHSDSPSQENTFGPIQAMIANCGVQRVVECLQQIKESVHCMKATFDKLTLLHVPGKVWHKEVSKLSLGHQGNGGPSGAQHATSHLLDVFLG